MQPQSVNQILSNLSENENTLVSVYGQITFEFEGNCISQIPKSERIDDYQSSIWISYNLEELGISKSQLERFNFRHVEVQGILSGPEQGFEGCGHFSLWPAILELKNISKYSPVK